MARDESRQHGDEHSDPDEVRHDDPGPITITTTDPAIEAAVEHRWDWKQHPDSTVRVETTQVSEPSPLYASGVRTVVVDDPQRPDRRHSDGGARSDEADHGGKRGGHQIKGVVPK